MRVETVLLGIREGCVENGCCEVCFGSGQLVNYRSLGRKLRNLREAAGRTHAEMGERLEVSESYVRHMESGIRRVGFEMLVKYLEALES
jgi:predicted transcriptional regulator